MPYSYGSQRLFMGSLSRREGNRQTKRPAVIFSVNMICDGVRLEWLLEVGYGGSWQAGRIHPRVTSKSTAGNEERGCGIYLVFDATRCNPRAEKRRDNVPRAAVTPRFHRHSYSCYIYKTVNVSMISDLLFQLIRHVWNLSWCGERPSERYS